MYMMGTDTQAYYENLIPEQYHVDTIEQAEALRETARELRANASTQDEIAIADTIGKYATYMMSTLEPGTFFQNVPAWMQQNLSRSNVPESVRVELQQRGIPLGVAIAAGGLLIGILILNKK